MFPGRASATQSQAAREVRGVRDVRRPSGGETELLRINGHDSPSLENNPFISFDANSSTPQQASPSESFLDTMVEEPALSLRGVMREERDCLKSHWDGRAEDGIPSSKKFSVAFSGGGMRAAAFQSGVLWRLAEMGLLKDVEYLSAVSGGGYITSAFASHCANASEPRPGEVRKWYTERVAETICRMHENSGNFVRDPGFHCGSLESISQALPRSFDCPVLILVIILTVLINPFYFFVCVVVPVVQFVELFFGAGLRAGFCAQAEGEVEVLLQSYSPFRWLLWLCLGLVAANFFWIIVTSIVPCFQGPLRRSPSEEAPPSRIGRQAAQWRCHYVGRATQGLLRRLTLFSFALLALLVVTIATERFKFLPAPLAKYRETLCSLYILQGEYRHDRDCADCADQFMGNYWYYDERMVRPSDIFPNSTFVEIQKLLEFEHNQSYANCSELIDRFGGRTGPLSKNAVPLAKDVQSFTGPVIRWLLLLMAAAAILIPIVGSGLLFKVMMVAGPAIVFTFVVSCTRFTVFGPVHGCKLGPTPYGMSMHYCAQYWRTFVKWLFLAWFILLPLYEEGRRTLHRYYWWCLCRNFFKDSRDMPFKQIADAKYCPYVILTGTSSDFMRGGDKSSIFELFFSALHCGGKELGFIHQPIDRTLGKCTALSGAGSLDAMTLTMSDQLAARFWLAVSGLAWGDFVAFMRKEVRGSGGIVRRSVKKSGCSGECLFMYLHRVVSGMPVFIFILLVNVGWYLETHSITKCGHVKLTMSIFLVMGLFLYVLSFYPFLPWLEMTAMSPILRHIHQATRFHLVGELPPPMLYVTDGGVQDCTALGQLLLRRCERILLVLAAQDAEDDLAVLNTALRVAEEKRLASFYVPDDPRTSVQTAFRRFKEDRSALFLHIGVTYPEEDSQNASSKGSDSEPELVPNFGHIFIVKNRLPPEWEGRPVQVPLTFEEIMDGEPPEPPMQREGSSRLSLDKLGGFPCCNCCHRRGLNCGPKFPHGTFTGYLWLSPMWFSSLCRLGYTISERALEEITKDTLTASWESAV